MPVSGAIIMAINTLTTTIWNAWVSCEDGEQCEQLAATIADHLDVNKWVVYSMLTNLECIAAMEKLLPGDTTVRSTNSNN